MCLRRSGHLDRPYHHTVIWFTKAVAETNALLHQAMQFRYVRIFKSSEMLHRATTLKRQQIFFFSHGLTAQKTNLRQTPLRESKISRNRALPIEKQTLCVTYVVVFNVLKPSSNCMCHFCNNVSSSCAHVVHILTPNTDCTYKHTDWPECSVMEVGCLLWDRNWSFIHNLDKL
jgi:hypothetical protein